MVIFVNIKEDKIKIVNIYCGFVGISFLFVFIFNDIVIDYNGCFFVVVLNDNVFYFLDKNLIFLKFLMMEEDGFEWLILVVLDIEGYFYVGCKDG